MFWELRTERRHPISCVCVWQLLAAPSPMGNQKKNQEKKEEN